MALLQQTTLQRHRQIKRQESYQRIWKPFLSVISTCAILYFFYHSVSGDHGILSLIKLNQEIEQTQEALQIAHAERISLEQKVSMMREDSLNVDLLDEQVRRVLGFVGKKETVYIINDNTNMAH